VLGVASGAGCQRRGGRTVQSRYWSIGLVNDRKLRIISMKIAECASVVLCAGVMHAADFESISTLPAGKPFVDGYVDASLSYWTAADNSALREVLIGGDAIVVAKH
jgi:hypothetical protein